MRETSREFRATKSQLFARVSHRIVVAFNASSCSPSYSASFSTRDSIVPWTRLYYRRGNAVIVVLAIVSTIVVIVIALWLGRRTSCGPRSFSASRLPTCPIPNAIPLADAHWNYFPIHFLRVNPCPLTTQRNSMALVDLTS